jgi:uncharacterized protein (TIGR03086 family)
MMADPIVFERVIDATIDEAFALFTEPERLRRWQAVSASVDLRVGGDYRLTVIPGSIAYGTFTEIEPGKRLVYTWGWKGDDAPLASASSVAVDFEPLGEQTKVTMTHSGLDEAGAASHSEGWTHYFDRLEMAASKGDAGRDPWGLAVGEYDLLGSAEATWAVCRQVMTPFTQDDREKATPCEGYTVHDLVEHLMGSMKGLGETAGAEVPDGIKAESAEDYIAQAVEPVLAAWRDRGTDGQVPFGEGEAPASMLAGILSLEFLLHGWDFAQATDQSLEVPDGLVAYVQGLAESTIRPEYRGEGQGFGEETVPSTSDPLTVLAAFTGRQT